MTLEALTREVAELKRRVDLAETKLAQQAGQFEFITGQLRDVQLYMHARFEDVDTQLGAIKATIAAMDAKFEGKFAALEAKFDSKFATLEAKVDALPRVIAELLAKR